MVFRFYNYMKSTERLIARGHTARCFGMYRLKFRDIKNPIVTGNFE